MTAATPFPPEGQPYTWDSAQVPPLESLKLWTEVGNGIDKSQTGKFSILVDFRKRGHRRIFTAESTEMLRGD